LMFPNRSCRVGRDGQRLPRYTIAHSCLYRLHIYSIVCSGRSLERRAIEKHPIATTDNVGLCVCVCVLRDAPEPIYQYCRQTRSPVGNGISLCRNSPPEYNRIMCNLLEAGLSCYSCISIGKQPKVDANVLGGFIILYVDDVHTA
jgi:hypothetical protein